MGYQIRNHHTDYPWGFLSKALRKRIRSIIQSFGQFLYLLLHVLTNLWTITKSTTDGSDADTQFLSQIFQRRSMLIYCHFLSYSLYGDKITKNL